jgi:hypothetical protein
MALLLAGACVGSASAHVYYVGPTGGNSQPGSRLQPWATFAYAFTRLQPGDTLRALAGTYYEKDVKVTGKAGTETAPIVIMAEPGDSVVWTAEIPPASFEGKWTRYSGNVYRFPLPAGHQSSWAHGYLPEANGAWSLMNMLSASDMGMASTDDAYAGPCCTSDGTYFYIRLENAPNRMNTLGMANNPGVLDPNQLKGLRLSTLGACFGWTAAPF